MTYPIKTLNQLPLLLRAFRKAQGLTQAVMAEKLGITQQSYAYFEANPATASLERLFTVLRLLQVEISLDASPSGNASADGLLAEAPAATSTPSISGPLSAPQAIPAPSKESW